MIANSLDDLRVLSDEDVVSALDDLARRDRQVSAAIVTHLVIVRERAIHLDLGYSSIVDYCVERLGCSKDVAYKRGAAVKVAMVHPEVLSWLADGTMTLCGLVALAPHRDDAKLVARARGKSKRQIQELVATEHPDPNWNRIQCRVRPVAEGISKIEMTVPNELVAQIEEVLDLDSHIDPSRDVVALLGRAIDTYVTRRKRERFAVTDRPRAGADRPTERVPAAAVRAAYEESGGQCQYVSPDGRRCTARAFLETDHVVPRARGGGHDQIRILCDAHNQRAAELVLGQAHMEAARDSARRRATLARDLGAALVEMGFSSAVAKPAARGAVEHLGPAAELEPLIKEALSRASSAHRSTASRARERGPVWRPLVGRSPALVHSRPCR